jgi:hypothetical protein
MSAAHTPGPWSYRPFEHDDWGIVRGPDGYVVANAQSNRVSDEEKDDARWHRTDPYEANARLIAAAPELLQALKALLEIVEKTKWGQPWPGRPHAECDRARAAIAKATGETP